MAGAEGELAEVVRAVERAYVAAATGGAPATLAMPPLAPALAFAAAAAVAARFLAIGTPRSVGLVGATAADRDRLLTCHAVWFAPFPELRVDTDDALVSAPGARRVSTAEALACDLVLVLRADAPIASASIRAGTHLSLAPGVTVDAALRARAIWHDDAALAQVAAGIVDGRQLDEVTVFAAGAANNAGP
jgi:hypothetical protein